MSDKFLYYLGAGASCKALPLAKSRINNFGIHEVEGLPFALENFDFSRLDSMGFPGTTTTWFKQRFSDLAKNAKEFGDVDTYAKYLYITQQTSELKKLKEELAYFFIYKQKFLNKLDSRYLPWLVSLMDKKTFPDNVKILNWNYDFQIELAFENISEIEDINWAGNGFVHSPSSIYHFPNLDPAFSDFDKLSLIHLNGIAGYERTTFEKSGSIYQKSKDFSDLKFVASYMSKADFGNLINFAWEESEYHKQLMKYVKTMISGVNYLVVIGYSFPFFNRKIDKEIFKIIFETGSLKKIYFQDPHLDGKQLRSQFGFSGGIPIEHINQTSNFHIPFEL